MIFDADMKVAAQAAQRWEERATVREGRKGQPTAAIETPQRLQARLDRLAEAARPRATAAPDLPPPSAAVLREIGLERTIGTSDYQNIAFLEVALAVSRFVGRVNIKASPTRRIGFGTGSMVSPRLLLTNNHVLRDPSEAQFSEVEFDYQLDRNGNQRQSYAFALRPDLFFMTDIDLDFTLVAVEERSKQNRDLKHYGWSKLIAGQGKVLLGEHVNIIQHPRGQFKQFVTRENEVVDVLERFLHYVTDTEPGSSGSLVYNDQWEVVALHHSGVPRMRDNQYIDKQGKVWDGRDPEDIAWVANEGIRVSKLVEFIRNQTLDGDKARMHDDLLNLEPPHAIEAARMADESGDSAPPPDPEPVLANDETPPVQASSPDAGSVSITVPLRITLGFGTPEPCRAAAPRTVDSPAPLADATAPAPVPVPGLVDALAEFRRSAARVYYDAAADAAAREHYYADAGIENRSPVELFQRLGTLLTRTHRTPLAYAPARHVYPWVDLRPGTPLAIRSIYSGKRFDPTEFISADLEIEAERARVAEVMAISETGLDRESALDLLEAQLPYNCEHVVPQSWFGKDEPMRGDLHHLFACESGCNSFRGNIPYYDFPNFEEALREECGKREKIGFEPTAGKGAVARATFYFLLRYPGVIGDAPGELTVDRLGTLLAWHQRYPVDDYERHRNAAIFEKQGNRNPLIDFPHLAEKIDFAGGIGRSPGAGPALGAGAGTLNEAIVAIAALDQMAEPEHGRIGLEADRRDFGYYEGLPAQIALLPDGRKASLLAPLTYHQHAGPDWPAQVGAVVDGASIPRIFWTLIGGPFEGRYREASIIHDVHCASQFRSSRETHRMFYEAMRCSGVGEIKAKIMYYAVARFGPQWDVQRAEANLRQRVATDADALTLVADAEAIFAHGLTLDEIDNLAEARNGEPADAALNLTEADTADPARLQRARRLVVTGGRGTIEDLEAVAREAATLPDFVMARFERKKIRILACRDSVTDFETSLRDQIPRGWEGTGRTWNDVPGTYLNNRKRVIIATIGAAAGRVVPGRDSGKHGSLCLTVHESLHGYDYSGGHDVLRDPAFVRARDADLGRLDAYQRQPGRAGLEETFAESGARYVAEPAVLQSECPNLFAYWRQGPNAEEIFAAGEMTAAAPLAATPDAAIGLIEEDAEGSICLHLRAEGPGDAIGHATFVYGPQDAISAAVRRQIPDAELRGEAAAMSSGRLLRPLAPGAAPKPRRRR